MKCQTIDCNRESKIKVRDGYHWIWVCTIHAQGYEAWRSEDD